MARFHVENIGGNQKKALYRLAQLVARGSHDPYVVRTARAIVQPCEARDDRCELEAIFNAVKHGDSRIPALAEGVRYVADPRTADFFSGPRALLEACADGVCAEDCDGSAVLVASLAAAIGFKVGVRAWGPGGSGTYEHVYAVAALPKKGPWRQGYAGEGLDVTVPSSRVGWQPRGGRVITYWVEDD